MKKIFLSLAIFTSMVGIRTEFVFAQKFKFPKKQYEVPAIKVSPAEGSMGLAVASSHTEELFSVLAQESATRAFDLTKPSRTPGLQNNPTFEREIAQTVAEYAEAQLKAPAESYSPRSKAPDRTPEQIYEEIKQFIREHNRFPSRRAKDPKERSLRYVFESKTRADVKYSNDPTIMRLKALKEKWVKKKADARSPQEVLEYITQYMRTHNGKLPSSQSEDPTVKSYYRAFVYFHNQHKQLSEEELNQLDEASRNLEKLYRETVRGTKSPQEWLSIVEPWVIEHQRFPSRYVEEERTMYQGVWNAVRNNPDDPASIRLKELRLMWKENLRTPQDWLNIIEPWVLEHERWPSHYIKEENLMNQGAYNAIHRHPEDPASIRLKELKEIYGKSYK